jgi:soluble lytic murein transglycosylase-like protein
MKTRLLSFGLVWALAVTAGVADTARVKDNARDYLALRGKAQAPTLTAAEVDGPRSPWRGKTVELYGRVVGLTNACTTAGAVTTLLLQFPGARDLSYLDFTTAQPLAAIDNIVHALADLPADAKPTDHFRLAAIILESDLPAAEQRYAADVARNPVAGAIARQVGATAPDKQGLARTGDATAPAPPQQDQRPVSRPGTQLPQLQGVAVNTIGTWKQWIGRINSKLTGDQLELIVRSVLYYSALYGVDHRLAFAMIKCESDFDPRCVSHSGATGLCQLMPGTARGLGVDPWDIEQNISGGIRYLAEQLKAYAGRSNYEQFALALASYNAGPNAVKRAGGIPNIPETIRYVKKVGDLFVQLHKTMP